MREDGKRSKDQGTVEQSRHDFLKGGGVVAGGLAAAAVPGLAEAASADSQTQDTAADTPSRNPYQKEQGNAENICCNLQTKPCLATGQIRLGASFEGAR